MEEKTKQTNKRFLLKAFGIAAALSVPLGLLGVEIKNEMGEERIVEFTVESKQRVYPRSGYGYSYLIDTDKGSFNNGSSMFKEKESSHAIYRSLKIGQRYKCTVYGGHLQLTRPNILACSPL